MKILHFVNAYFPSTGGTVTRIHNLFHNDPHEHTFVIPISARVASTFPNGNPPLDEQIENLRIRRVLVPTARGVRRFLPGFYREQARRLIEPAIDEAPDILYGHNPLTCALASHAYHRLHPEIPFLYEAHGIMRDFSNVGPGHPLSAIRDGLTRRMLGRLERRVFADVHVAIAQTHAARRRIIELYGQKEDRVAVIHNGVDLDHFSAARWRSQGAAIRSRRGWEQKTIVFYAGYLDEVNGTATLIDAAMGLTANDRKRLKIVIAGKGPRESDVRRAAEAHPECIEFLGAVPHDEMPHYYSATDVFVIPRPPFRPAETLLPMKLLEAMAMEKLVVVSSVAGMTDVVEEGKNGLVYPKGNPRALPGILQRLPSDESADAMRRRARETVATRFSWTDSRAQLDDLYHRVHQRRSGSAELHPAR